MFRVRLRLISAALMVLFLSASVLSCARVRARTQPEMQPLAPPAPPPRVVIGNPLAQLPVEVNGESEEPPAPRPANRTPGPRTEAAKPEAVVAPPKVETPAPEPSPPPAEAKPEEAATLKMMGTVNDAEAERRINDTLARAQRDLGRVDYARLKSEAQAQYDSAKRFMLLAQNALRARNYVYATSLADKAATLAAALLGG